MGYYDKELNYINKFGSVFDTYGAVSLAQIFSTQTIGDKVKKREGAPAGQLRDFYGCNTNACVASRIYFAYFNMVIADALSGDIIKLSNMKNFPVIRVGSLSEEASEKKLKYSAVPGINYRALDYRLPRMVIDYGPTSDIVDRIIHMPKKLYAEMLNNIRAGKVYTKIRSTVKKVK